MILFMWAMIFMVAVLPGGIVGWLVGKLPVSTPLCVAFSAGGSVVLGLVASKRLNSGDDLQIHYHVENLVMFWPPIMLALLLGLWINRVKKRSPPRPWYLPPENSQ
jgi:hypothetical protein